jgi:hypothetical protein
VKLHHAAALALVGWYLMVPPYSGSPRRYDDLRPLKEWKSVGQVHDSLAECKRDKAAKFAQMYAVLGVASTKWHLNRDILVLNWKNARMATQCIATGDPRLESK